MTDFDGSDAVPFEFLAARLSDHSTSAADGGALAWSAAPDELAVPWTPAPDELTPAWSAAPDELAVPWTAARDELTPAWSAAPDELAVPWTAARDELTPAWSAAPDEPPLPWCDPVPVGGDQLEAPDLVHDDAWVDGQAERLRTDGLTQVTVQSLYEQGATLEALRDIGSELYPSPEVGRYSAAVHSESASPYDRQLTNLVDDLRDRWRLDARRLDPVALQAATSELARSAGSTAGETFADLQLQVYAGELQHRLTAAAEAWVNAVPVEVAEAEIAEMRLAASVANDAELMASVTVAERVLHAKVFLDTLATMDGATLIDLRARSAALEGRTGVVAAAERAALAHREANLGREYADEVVTGEGGHVETRYDRDRRVWAERYAKESEANRDPVGAVVLGLTRDPELAVALSGLSSVALSTAAAQVRHGQLNQELGRAPTARITAMASRLGDRPDARLDGAAAPPGVGSGERFRPVVVWGSPWTRDEAKRFEGHFRSFGGGPVSPARYAERFDAMGGPARSAAVDHFHGGGLASRAAGDRPVYGVRIGYQREPGPYMMEVFDGPTARADAVAFAKAQVDVGRGLRAGLGVPDGWQDGSTSRWTHAQVVEISPVGGRGAALWSGVVAPQHDWARAAGGRVSPESLAIGGLRQVLVDPACRDQLRVIDAFAVPNR